MYAFFIFAFVKIIFAGTPEFAATALAALLKTSHEIIAVYTQPDRKAGRGQKIKYSAVKEYALENNLNLLQPTNLKDESFLEELKSLNANLSNKKALNLSAFLLKVIILIKVERLRS